MEKENSLIMSMDELCNTLNVSKNVAYKLLQSGEIKAGKLGRVWKIERQSVYDFVNKNFSKNINEQK